MYINDVASRYYGRQATDEEIDASRRLYAALGYEEVPAFNDSRYAEHWLAKPLAQWHLAPGRHPVCRSR